MIVKTEIEAIKMAKNLVLWPTERLKPYEKNARTHSPEQVAQIAASIAEFGFTNPILVDTSDGIIAGHGRLMAAQKLGLTEVPVVVLDHLTDAQRRAYILADNKLALNAGWDENLLADELRALDAEGFDLGLTGFSDDELADLLPEVEVLEPQSDEDDVPDALPEPKVVRGEVYILGKHRLMCGDAKSIDDVRKLTGNRRIDIAITDPPYGISAVSKDGKVGGDTKHAPAKTYIPVHGDEDTTAAREAYQVLSALEVPKLIIWGGNYFTDFLPPSPCWIIWDKQRPEGLTFADGEVAWTNFKSPLKFIRHRWDGYHRASERDQSRIHPTQKPAHLTEWCIREYAPEAETVIDLFGGSGSALIGCEKIGKVCFMMEFEPRYVGAILDRWQKYTGKKAMREDGKLWDEIKAE